MRRATVCWSLVSSTTSTCPLAVSGFSATPGVGPAGGGGGAEPAARREPRGSGRAGGQGPLDVSLDDPPTGPRPGEPMQIEPAVASDPLGDRRGLDASVASARGCGGRRAAAAGAGAAVWPGRRGAVAPLEPVAVSSARGSRRCRRRRHRHLRRVPDPRDRSPTGSVSPSCARISMSVPASVGLVDHVRLVGLDLDQLVADRDLVADALQPAQDRPLLHRVGEPRHDDLAPSATALQGRSAALTTCSACGIAACSMRFE